MRGRGGEGEGRYNYVSRGGRVERGREVEWEGKRSKRRNREIDGRTT